MSKFLSYNERLEIQKGLKEHKKFAFEQKTGYFAYPCNTCVYETYRDELMCSEKTLCNYIDARLFDVRNIDLPRMVKYRPRYKKPKFKVDRACRNERDNRGFRAFMEAHPDTNVVHMNSVCGTQGGKVLFTIRTKEKS